MATEKRNNRHYKDTNSYYTYGNVVYDLYPTFNPYKADEEMVANKKKEKRLAQAESRNHYLATLRMLCVTMVLFIGSLAFVWMNVLVDNAEVSLRRQKEELESLKIENAVMEAELMEQVDLDYVKLVATERLGMRTPQAYQVVYIDVPKQSYTIQHADDELKQELPIWTKTKNLFRKILS